MCSFEPLNAMYSVSWSQATPHPCPWSYVLTIPPGPHAIISPLSCVSMWLRHCTPHINILFSSVSKTSSWHCCLLESTAFQVAQTFEQSSVFPSYSPTMPTSAHTIHPIANWHCIPACPLPWSFNPFLYHLWAVLSFQFSAIFALLLHMWVCSNLWDPCQGVRFGALRETSEVDKTLPHP